MGGRKEGKRIEVLAPGGNFDRELINGKRNGYGTCCWNDDSKYEGHWKNDIKEGQGTMTWSDGSKYEGPWESDKREGQGTMTWSDGSKYEGHWKNDKFDGQGKWTLKDGTTYEGKFLRNTLLGNHIVTRPNGRQTKEKFNHWDRRFDSIENVKEGRAQGELIELLAEGNNPEQQEER